MKLPTSTYRDTYTGTHNYIRLQTKTETSRYMQVRYMHAHAYTHKAVYPSRPIGTYTYRQVHMGTDKRKQTPTSTYKFMLVLIHVHVHTNPYSCTQTCSDRYRQKKCVILIQAHPLR